MSGCHLSLGGSELLRQPISHFDNRIQYLLEDLTTSLHTLLLELLLPLLRLLGLLLRLLGKGTYRVLGSEELLENKKVKRDRQAALRAASGRAPPQKAAKATGAED